MTGGIYDVHLRALIKYFVDRALVLTFNLSPFITSVTSALAVWENCNLREFSRKPHIWASRLIRGHFRVPKTLTFKTRLSAKPLLWFKNEFYLHWNKNHFMSMVSHLKLEATWIFFWVNELLCFNLDELSQRMLHFFLMLFRAILAGGGGGEEAVGGSE